MKELPVIRRIYLSENEFVQQIVGAALPGSKKLQFPFEVPTVETKNEVIIPSGTAAVLVTTVTVLAAGMIISAVVKNRKS